MAGGSARLVFLGSPDFSVPSLHTLATDDRYTVSLVVSQPDRPAGRGRRPQPPPVKHAAIDLGLPLLQPPSLRSPEVLDALRAARAEVFVVVAFGEILRRAVLELPPAGVLNVHPSLLPRYRGSSPIPAAILHGDTETGVSVIKLVRALDAGPILRRQTAPLTGRETAGSLSRELADVAARLLPDTIADWLAGRIVPVPQDDELASYTRELTKDDGRVDWSVSAVHIERLVRAMNPWPGAWTTLAGRRMTLLEVDISLEPTQNPPGTLTRRGDRPAVEAADGLVVLERVKPEGRPAMRGADWLHGARLGGTRRGEPDTRFDVG